MERLLIHETKYSPRVDLNPDGKISIIGKSLLEDPFVFYNPILSWAKDYNSHTLEVELKLEYLNTSSSKQLFAILLGIQDNFNILQTNVKWFYEVDDEDSLELGKEFESQTTLHFDFLGYTDEKA
jgi:hypothetical protein